MQTRINLSDVICSAEFSQSIKILRASGGKTVQGEYTQNLVTIVIPNVVVTATDENDTVFIPEGDRRKESKTFHSVVPLYASRSDAGNADIVTYNSKQYKIISTIYSGDYGYYKSIGISVGVDK